MHRKISMYQISYKFGKNDKIAGRKV